MTAGRRPGCLDRGEGQAEDKLPEGLLGEVGYLAMELALLRQVTSSPRRRPASCGHASRGWRRSCGRSPATRTWTRDAWSWPSRPSFRRPYRVPSGWG